MRGSTRVAAILILMFVYCVSSAGSAHAGSATRMLGFSTRDSAMAGATTASSEDTSCLVRNPAGMLQSGSRVDIEYINILPHHVSMRTEGQAIAPNPASLSNVGLEQRSTIDYIGAGNGGIIWRLPGSEKHPVAFGLGVFTMSGIALNYPCPRINTAMDGSGNANGIYDRFIDLRSTRIAPGLAVGLTDKLFFGATANIGIQGLRTDMAKNNLRETVGSGKWDFTTGGGFTLGLLYRYNEMLSLGASYESHGWMGYHYKYKDTLPYIDEPPVINAGISFKPVKDIELTFDTRYINWTDIKIARLAPVSGGFGWTEQWVFATGGEYTFKDKLKLRLGYVYNRSPIGQKVTFANALLPVIMEHHLTTGFSYMLTKKLSADLTWEHHFMGAQADNGAGDVYSLNGVGTKVTAAVDIISIGLGYKF